MIKLVGAALLLTVTALLLRRLGFAGAPVFAAVCVVLLLTETVGVLGNLFKSAAVIGEVSSVQEPLGAAIKTLGVGYLFGVCADICRELGESGIAKAVEAVGRVEIIALVFPYFEQIIKVGVELVG